MWMNYSVQLCLILLTNFSYGGQSQRRSAICVEDIIVQRVCAQVQVHSLFLYSHNPVGRQSNTTGEYHQLTNKKS